MGFVTSWATVSVCVSVLWRICFSLLSSTDRSCVLRSFCQGVTRRCLKESVSVVLRTVILLWRTRFRVSCVAGWSCRLSTNMSERKSVGRVWNITHYLNCILDPLEKLVVSQPITYSWILWIFIVHCHFLSIPTLITILSQLTPF